MILSKALIFSPRAAWIPAFAGMTFFSLFTAAHAQQAPVSGLDSKQPIEINADALEVRQQENVAVFTGNVLAVQGQTRLKSDKMTVFYEKKGDSPAAAADPGQGAVKRIEVDGSVLLTTPEETASGDRGVYDVEHKQVTLTSNVVLTRGKNVLKGDTLVYDFATGRSVVNAPQQVQGVPNKNGRVRALFVPEKKGP